MGCTHVLTFCQANNGSVVVRVFGCQYDNNTSIQLLTCIDTMERDNSLSQAIRYYSAHLLLSTKLLRSCFCGYLFPYELVDWLSKLVCTIERLFTFSFESSVNNNNMWLLSNDNDHWSFNTIKDKLVNHSDFRFDTLHVYWHFNCDEFLRFLKQCILERGPFRIKVNTEKMVNCIDTTHSIVNTMYGERLDMGWFNSNFECHASKEWCPIEFKREHLPFFSDLIGHQIKKHDTHHFSSMALIDLLNVTTASPPQQDDMPFLMTSGSCCLNDDI